MINTAIITLNVVKFLLETNKIFVKNQNIQLKTQNRFDWLQNFLAKNLTIDQNFFKVKENTFFYPVNGDTSRFTILRFLEAILVKRSSPFSHAVISSLRI